MTWVVDGSERRWVEPAPIKRRSRARAVRFADLRAGDVIARMVKNVRIDRDPLASPSANDNRRETVSTSWLFARCEHRWFDPVAGQADPVAGQYAGIRMIGPSPAYSAALERRTLRALAQQGYHPLKPDQGRAVLEWVAARDALKAEYEAGTYTFEQARLRHVPWRLLLSEVGLKET